MRCNPIQNSSGPIYNLFCDHYVPLFMRVCIATQHFEGLRAKDKRCEFVLGGWHDSQPFFGVVSNYVSLNESEMKDMDLRHHMPSYSESACARTKFQGWIERFNRLTERHYSVKAMGDCDPSKLKTGFRGLEGLLKKGVSASRICEACRQIASEAGRHSKTIGKDLIAIDMERDGQIHSSYYSENGSEAMLIPDMLSIEGAWTQMRTCAIASDGELKLHLQGKIRKRLMGT